MSREAVARCRPHGSSPFSISRAGLTRVLDDAPGAQDTRRLELTDPAHAALCEFGPECEFCWKRPPSAAVRSAILWNKVLKSLPERGRGCKVHLLEPRLMIVAPDAIAQAMRCAAAVENGQRQKKS